MGLERLTSAEAVQQAIDEFEELGRESFLEAYGFGPSSSYFISVNGNLYDSKAIAGAAYGFQHPDDGPLTSNEFSGGEETTSRLRALGFEIAQATDVERPRAVDRNSHDAAQHIFESIVSPEHREACLALFAESIAAAHKHGPSSWTLNLFHDRWQFNVGSVRALWASRQGFAIVLSDDALNEDDRARLEELGSFTSSAGAYRSIGSAIDYRFAPQAAEEVREIAAPAHEAVIAEAARQVTVARTAKAFSPGALEYLRDASGRDLPEPGFLAAPTSTTAWIFQANPELYDIDRAIRERQTIQWTVRQNKRRVRSGHRAYIWRAGPDSGIIALGTVLTDPETVPPTRDEDEFYRRRENFDRDETRVDIRRDRVIEPHLPLSTIAADPALRDLKILHFRNATVFAVSPEEDARLQELVGQERRYWWVNQGVSFGAAREAAVISAPTEGRGASTPAHWKTMRDVRPNDIVLNYANGEVRAVSTVQREAEERADTEDQRGARLVAEVSYRDVEPTVKLNDIPEQWRIEELGPFNRNGGVNQGYLYPLSTRFVARIAERFPQLELDVRRTGPDGGDTTLAEIENALADEGLKLNNDVARRYHTSLRTRGFVILTGISGTGKTWLAEAYARATSARALVVPVAPNWTTNEDLLGYLNPIDQQYHDTEFSQFLRSAAAEYTAATAEQRTPAAFHLILDEMNLARVEYYFAKFLSAMELRARSGSAAIELAPGQSVELTPNLFFTGTVNVDETTHGFADKVYDRAQLIELTIDRNEVVEHLRGQPYADVLTEIWESLVPVAPFAFRVLDDIKSYIDESTTLDVPWQKALDEQLMQKVLPKLKGTDLALGPALSKLVEICADQFPLSHEKAARMQSAFNEHGFTSYF